MAYFDLIDFLKEKTIVNIYKGKDNYCRCGCGGRYHSPNANTKNMLKNVNNYFKDLYEKGDYEAQSRFFMKKAEGNGDGFINIPIYDKNNKCYCIYYKNKS